MGKTEKCNLTLLVKNQIDIENIKNSTEEDLFLFFGEEIRKNINELKISEIKDDTQIFKFHLSNKIISINESIAFSERNDLKLIIKSLKNLKDKIFDEFQRNYPEEIRWYKDANMFKFLNKTDGNFPIYSVGFKNDKEKRFIDFNTLKTDKNINNPLKKTWFKIGIDFANGKIFELINKGCNYSEISRQLYNSDSFKNYISESFSTNPSNKNKAILQDKVKMSFIKEYFDKNNKDVNEKFIEYFNKLN